MNFNNIWTITILVLAMLALERIILLKAIRHPNARAFIRSFWLLHPNALSILRLPMGCISIYIVSLGHWSLAVVWFAFWMITDLSDGTIARGCDLGTETGKWLDPLSDKFMYFPPLLFFCFSNKVTPALETLPVIAFIVVDIVGQGSRLFVKKKAANQFGKAKTALTTVLIALIALNQIDSISIVNKPTVDALMYACLILGALSCYCKIIPDNWYANTLTLANFVCGLLAIWQAWSSHYILCMVLVFVGQFFDLFDGRLARKFGSTKRGPLFDDIADATSFGLAIGTMIFKCLSDKLPLPMWASLVLALFYVCCLIYRLYRFLKPTENLPNGIFQGTPSPAGAMLAGSSILAALAVGEEWAMYCSALLVVFSACLMVSKVHYCHFGQVILPQIPKGIKLLIAVMIIILTVMAIAMKYYRPAFVWTCFLGSLIYTIYGMQKINKLSCPEIKCNGEDAQ